MSRLDRRRRPDGKDTRMTILEAAGRIFAQQGQARTTGKDVAAAAGVNTAAINYYFGGVEGLYSKVLAEAHRRLVSDSDLEQLKDPQVPASDRLRTYLAEGLRTMSSPDEAWAMRVIGREILAPSPVFASFARDVLAPKQEVAKRLVAEIVGRPPEDPIVPFALQAAMAPLDILLLADPEVVRGMTSTIAADPAALEKMVDQLHRFALGGLRALGEDRERSPPDSRP